MEVLARKVSASAKRWELLSDFDLAEELAQRAEHEDRWAELCKWGAVAVGVLCLTSLTAALILTYLEHV
ncbi:hypothetical protein [Ramlibacter sp.]|uniref:hypothetical protein n=1 Tax=Ramlibacter sp. TaxID=1917967 RepID=UPI00260D64FE|nr:hypothetical protein [Ramlibacter sp.]MDB5954514.1 hypothetical protein [Ramlibacter sp.]